MLGLLATQDLADAVVDRRVGGVLLAVHLEIHVERGPAGAEVRLPLQLHVATGDRQRHFVAVLVVKGDRAVLGVDLLHRHIHHAPRFGVDRQEDRIGLRALFAQRLQHHRHDLVVLLAGAQQHLVELARAVEFARGIELVLEAEGVEEPAQHGVVVMAKALMRAEGVRHGGQRLVHMLCQHLPLRHVARHLAHTVEVVRETHQLGRDVADLFKGALDHRGAQHFAEGADMRQARGAIARLEQDVTLLWRLLGIAFEHPARFFKGPCFAAECRVSGLGHVRSSIFWRPCAQCARGRPFLLLHFLRVNILHRNIPVQRIPRCPTHLPSRSAPKTALSR